MVEAIAAQKGRFRDETLQDNRKKNVAWLYEHGLRNCTANPWHRRYQPQRLRANQLGKYCCEKRVEALDFRVSA